MADVGLEGADGAGAAAHRRGGGRAQAGTPGLVGLGFADDLPGYLRDGYKDGRLPVLALARKLGIGNREIKQGTGRHRRSAPPARRGWGCPSALGIRTGG